MPCFTVKVAGLKAKLLMVTLEAAPWVGLEAAGGVVEEVDDVDEPHPAASIATIGSTNNSFRIFFR